VIGLNVKIHQSFLVIFDVVEVIQIFQRLKLVIFSQNLLGHIQSADCLTVHQNLVDLDFVHSHSLVGELIQVEMNLKEYELLSGEPFVVLFGLVSEINLLGHQFDKLVLNQRSKLIGLGKCTAVLPGKYHDFQA
jgi:hypothetical protein